MVPNMDRQWILRASYPCNMDDANTNFDHFNMVAPLGRGCQSIVTLVQHEASGELLAGKVQSDQLTTRGFPVQADIMIREVAFGLEF
jgi:hypothetical protein